MSFWGLPEWALFVIVVCVMSSGGGVGLWLTRMRVRRSLRTDLNRIGIPTCLGCGYDLRGHDDITRRCPECGLAISQERNGDRAKQPAKGGCDMG
jgi:predicted RNA-binding Zn-ribbon protein involved in translation (DUF1610 family)